MKYSDRPIYKPAQDLLGRSSFALTLARSVDQLSIAKEGFVMSIVGEWGSGKTSIIELLCRYLRHIEMERNSAEDGALAPSSLDELEEMGEFFEAIEPLFGDAKDRGYDVSMWQSDNLKQQVTKRLPDDADANGALRYWRLLQRVSDDPKTLVIRFSPWLIAGQTQLSMALLGELARSLGPRLGREVHNAFANLLQRLSELGPLASAAIGMAGGAPLALLAKAGFDLSKSAAERLSVGPTLEQLRKDLRKALHRLNDQKILVIVDDLDRLTPGETLEMVSLVKCLGDLPNTVYLLSYDEAQMSDNLLEAKVGGLRYLEKIVQYSVWVPQPPDGSMLDLVNQDLGEILGDIEQEDQDRLGIIWQYSLRHYISNPRDARRLANALAIPASGLSQDTDLPDLVLLEALRIFDPSVYAAIRQNIDIFAR